MPAELLYCEADAQNVSRFDLTARDKWGLLSVQNVSR